MFISRITVHNFRNFKFLDVSLSGNMVLVGENRIGKSNLVYALRLIFDPSLPDSSRQLTRGDFWDKLPILDKNTAISISVEVQQFDSDMGLLCLLTDFRLDADPNTVRLTYEFAPKANLEGEPKSDEDYDFVCYGGENKNKTFSHDLRRRITMDLLPALRDAEGDLATWRRSPLRPLIEDAFSRVNQDDLRTVKDAVEGATNQLAEFDSVESLADLLRTQITAMTGARQDVRPLLGFSSTDVTRLYRNIRLLIDDGARTIGEASLGSANIVYLTLKAMDIKRLMDANKRNYTFLAIEEPEAHLHPHLQRSVYRRLFEEFNASADGGSLSIVLTTHSPHIASVAPVNSIILLKDDGPNGTIGRSTADVDLTTDDFDDLARYLDVTRAEILFARGVILVEGDAEKFLFPVMAATQGFNLDKLGITICSVSGTNFSPYAKLLTALSIPFSIVTDWDPRPGKQPLGANRSASLAIQSEGIRDKAAVASLRTKLQALINDSKWNVLCTECEAYGIFSNLETLEVDLFNEPDFTPLIIATLNEQKFGAERKALISAWEADPSSLDEKAYLAMIEDVGKGRFAQRLAARIADVKPPGYIQEAIEFVVNRV